MKRVFRKDSNANHLDKELPHGSVFEGRVAPVELAEIAGYRVVRRLAAGSRASVYVGHPLGGVPQTGAQAKSVLATPDEDAAVVLRVFHTDVDSVTLARIDAEIAALSSVPAGVAAQLHDVVTLPDGRICLVMERNAGPSLAELLNARSSVRAGEAVTILATLIAALSRLHNSGWVHGALSTAVVCFGQDGRPRFSEWSRATTHGEALERTNMLRLDYEAFVTIVRQTCASIDAQSVGRRELEALIAWMSDALVARPFLPFAEQLERRLFALAKPLAVRLGGESASHVRPTQSLGEHRLAVPARVGPTVLPHQELAAAQSKLPMKRPGEQREMFLTDGQPHGPVAGTDLGEDDPQRAPRGWLRSLVASEPIGVVLAGAREGLATGGRLSGTRQRVASLLRARRTPLLVAACVAGSVFVLAITLIPPDRAASDAGSGGGREQMSQTVSTGVPAATSKPETGVEIETSPSAGGVAPHGAGASAQVTSEGAADVVRGGDPVLAARELLQQRAECFRESSVICIDGVDSSGGPLAEADARSIREAQQNGVVVLPASYAADSIALVEQNGAAVLLSMASEDPETKPASLLMMKSEAGWRLREIFDY